MVLCVRNATFCKWPNVTVNTLMIFVLMEAWGQGGRQPLRSNESSVNLAGSCDIGSLAGSCTQLLSALLTGLSWSLK